MSDERIAIVRTSDRSNFKRCRRKWHFESGLRLNRTSIDRPSYFWIGTGGHFALEDFHGHNYYGNPVTAFEAYCNACVEAGKHGKIKPPDDYDEQRELGIGILTHYLEWIQDRDPLETAYINDEPQVEVKCMIELPVPDNCKEVYDKVYYQMTIDRLVIIDNEYWIQDWKFYKNFYQGPLEWFGQLSAYIWAANAMWHIPIAGGILHEFRKDVPNGPRILKNGDISAAKDQLTTRTLYKQALEDKYGEVNKAPAGNIKCLNLLAEYEHEHGDRFIRRQFTRRTPAQIESEGTRILMELEEMLDPNLPIYTNPTKDCSWDCSNSDVCLMMDRDDDWEYILNDTTVDRAEDSEDWRNYLETRSEHGDDSNE